MFKILTKYFSKPHFRDSYSFSSFEKVDFQNFYPIIKDQKTTENFEFKLLLDNREGKRFLFDLSKSDIIQDLLNKIIENFQFKELSLFFG